MQYSLMKAIFDYIIENRDEFQLYNATKDHFRPYIFNDKGEYLIGGEQVSAFISDAINLMYKGAKR